MGCEYEVEDIINSNRRVAAAMGALGMLLTEVRTRDDLNIRGLGELMDILSEELNASCDRFTDDLFRRVGGAGGAAPSFSEEVEREGGNLEPGAPR